MDNNEEGSGVGVLDKAATLLSALEAGAATLSELVDLTGLARPTVHRHAVALEYHRFVARDPQGRFVLGPRIAELAHAIGEDRMMQGAGPVLRALRDHTHESAQLYRRQGEHRLCVANADLSQGLISSIPVGAVLSMKAGSAAQILLAWEEPDRLHLGLIGASFSASQLAGVRRRGWAQSIAEREPGVASVSAPIRDKHGDVVGAISISGPIERIGRQPGRVFGPAVIAAGKKLSEFMNQE
ncbi:MAG: IclR family transcriptional regulator [Varibaculum sp.]|nr:IclR family transcriptional regulator [Varibaculum sp.]